MSVNYHVYANSGTGGPINYATPIATVTSPGYTTAALTAGLWSFAVRAFDPATGLEEQNADCAIDITVSASLADISNVPFAPQALTATVVGSGVIRVSWSYPYGRGRLPTGFHVYQGSPSVPSYASSVATVTFNGVGYLHYHADITGLTGGTQYAFGVRAYNASGEESNTVVVLVTAVTAAPSNVDSLAIA